MDNKAKPILFSTPMVQAIMDGRKTMTRRVCHILTLNYPQRAHPGETAEAYMKRWNTSPKHQIGDVLWVREAVKRLAAYESSGLTPERAQELGKAGAEGRVVVLPCDDNVELERDGIVYKADHWNHSLTCFADNQPTPSGKKVALFGTDEAQAALARMKEADHD